ncbi:unnamed protein product [Cyprideis torosa]|uniref:Uncharacterized protein n=1 Tax=Cyprideis torosa TaxID=163714 RepID=A0A7R8WAL7_9CRUS|nr:unnamed protein product [Cyprideis torosa]CAG0889813.1 unnamed protein product [Cyprideis torosa]
MACVLNILIVLAILFFCPSTTGFPRIGHPENPAQTQNDENVQDMKRTLKDLPVLRKRGLALRSVPDLCIGGSDRRLTCLRCASLTKSLVAYPYCCKDQFEFFPFCQLDNLKVCLSHLNSCGVPLDEGVSAQEICDGNLRVILGLFFAISRFSKQKSAHNSSSKPLLETQQHQTAMASTPRKGSMIPSSRLPAPSSSSSKSQLKRPSRLPGKATSASSSRSSSPGSTAGNHQPSFLPKTAAAMRSSSHSPASQSNKSSGRPSTGGLQKPSGSPGIPVMNSSPHSSSAHSAGGSVLGKLFSKHEKNKIIKDNHSVTSKRTSSSSGISSASNQSEVSNTKGPKKTSTASASPGTKGVTDAPSKSGRPPSRPLSISKLPMAPSSSIPTPSSAGGDSAPPKASALPVVRPVGRTKPTFIRPPSEGKSTAKENGKQKPDHPFHKDIKSKVELLTSSNLIILMGFR